MLAAFYAIVPNDSIAIGFKKINSLSIKRWISILIWKHSENSNRFSGGCHVEFTHSMLPIQTKVERQIKWKCKFRVSVIPLIVIASSRRAGHYPRIIPWLLHLLWNQNCFPLLHTQHLNFYNRQSFEKIIEFSEWK